MYEDSYTVSVSLPAPPPPPFLPVFSVASTRYSRGDTFSATVTANVGISLCSLYAWAPGSSSDGYYLYSFSGGMYTKSVPVSFTFPANEPLGEWTFQIKTYPYSNPSVEVSSPYYTVTVQ